MKIIVLLFVTCAVSSAATKSKESVSFKSPKNGANVSSPVKVVMSVTGKKIRKAGEDPDDKTTGHHHLLIDEGPTQEGIVVPADATHLHFGAGQTETELKLTPGKHKLTLQFADGAHRSYGPAMSSTIEINVK